MYTIHLAILIIFIVLMPVCIPVSIPSELKKEEVYLIPFYKLAGAWYKISGRLKKKRNGASKVRGELSLLNPARSVDVLVEIYEIKRLGKSLMLLFAGNIIAFMICLSGMMKTPLTGENAIERNDYGKGEKSVALDVYVDGKEIMKNREVVVEERRYTPEETREIFDTIISHLEEGILGRNLSLDAVCYDLELPGSVEGYPVGIQWELSDYGVMDSEGHLKTSKIPEDGCIERITAILTYGGLSAEHSFNVMLYPPPKNDERSLEEKLEDEMEVSNEGSLFGQYSILPTTVDGHPVTYKPHESSDSLLLTAVAALAAGVLFKAAEKDVEKSMKKRATQMMIDYPQIVSKLTLLIGAGMTIKAAFEKIALDHERKGGKELRYAYEEMLLCVREMSGGMAEADAYVRFGNRCRLQKYVKLGAMLSQNLKRGSAGLLEILENEERDAFEERKSLARRLGEEAGTKLLAPMGIMLVIVMVVVVIPAFLSVDL